MEKQQVVTRFAPSPTGKFQLGNARTALFNYLFARHNNGRFLLRIEDTDRARSSDEYVKDISESLLWLGLTWDNRNNEHYQSKRLAEYQKIAHKLVTLGHAYEQEGAIFFKVKSSGKEGEAITFTDLIHGKVATKLAHIEDFVILKSDNYPTFHLAVVVDDNDMGVTHVIRGDDHLSNTPKHILLYRALGWSMPHWGHLPLILNKDKTKMSKRKDPVSVRDDFMRKGYLPEALVNYLALLGWNPKTNEEFFRLDELVKIFDLKNSQKSNAVFDIEKLQLFNGHYLRKIPLAQIANPVAPTIKEKLHLKEIDNTYLQKVCALSVERAKTVVDLSEEIDYFFLSPKLNYDDIVFRSSTLEKTILGLTNALKNLEALSKKNWETTAELRKCLDSAVNTGGLGNGDVFWPVRYALSGAINSPKPEELLYVLGKDESLRRIRVVLDLLQ